MKCHIPHHNRVSHIFNIVDPEDLYPVDTDYVDPDWDDNFNDLPPSGEGVYLPAYNGASE